MLEGAAHGRPLIASAVPGCKEVVDHNSNGFLFEVKNSHDLQEKIKDFLVLDYEAREQMGLNSRKLVEERYDENKVVSEYEQLIQQFIPSS